MIGLRGNTGAVARHGIVLPSDGLEVVRHAAHRARPGGIELEHLRVNVYRVLVPARGPDHARQQHVGLRLFRLQRDHLARGFLGIVEFVEVALHVGEVDQGARIVGRDLERVPEEDQRLAMPVMVNRNTGKQPRRLDMVGIGLEDAAVDLLGLVVLVVALMLQCFANLVGKRHLPAREAAADDARAARRRFEHFPGAVDLPRQCFAAGVEAQCLLPGIERLTRVAFHEADVAEHVERQRKIRVLPYGRASIAVCVIDAAKGHGSACRDAHEVAVFRVCGQAALGDAHRARHVARVQQRLRFLEYLVLFPRHRSRYALPYPQTEGRL